MPKQQKATKALISNNLNTIHIFELSKNTIFWISQRLSIQKHESIAKKTKQAKAKKKFKRNL